MQTAVNRSAFSQVDVFTDTPLLGNPLAVVHRADGWDADRMAAFARWTHLSETAFLLPPTDAAADYRVRIFTPDRELPFAGHPTLGSCHAWLAAGGSARTAGAELVQQCGVGLVRIRRDAAGRLAFAAPPLCRSGPVDAATLAHIAAALRIAPAAIRASNWVDNGPGWVAVMLASRDELLALRPDFAAMRGLPLGVVAPWPAAAVDAAVGAAGSAAVSAAVSAAEPAAERPQFEVRAFVPELGVPEDPVTGSLNAGLAQWLIGAGLAPPRYVASQGSALGRRGRVHVEQHGADIWVGGHCVTCIEGTLSLP